MKSAIVLILLCFIVISCNPGAYVDELPGGYRFEDRGPNFKNLLNHHKKKHIYANVVEYDYNSDFIVAKQKPNLTGHIEMLGYELRDDLEKYPTNSTEERLQSERVADSILKNNPHYKSVFHYAINYWIIVIDSNEVIGPMNLKEYRKRRSDLNISDSVELPSLK